MLDLSCPGEMVSIVHVDDRPRLQDENHLALIGGAIHKSKREVDELLARWFPKPGAAHPFADCPPRLSVPRRRRPVTSMTSCSNLPAWRRPHPTAAARSSLRSLPTDTSS